MGMLIRIERTHGVAEVGEGLWLGPMPDSDEFVRSLRADCGVTGVVSFQTDLDLRAMGVSWREMESMLRRGGIGSISRAPIVDFDEAALASELPRGIDAVHRLRAAGHATYLHCTAGLNRSPTVAIGYLVAIHGMTLDQAWEAVSSRRRVLPLRGALERWLDALRRSA
jgi:hypothetical protein